MIYTILFILFIIILLYLYLYVKFESFKNKNPITISEKLIAEISKIIGVSPRRISNLTFTGDISKRQLNVSFNILEANLIELSNNEMNAIDATTFSNNLFESGNFIVNINNKSILLNQNIKSDTKPTDYSSYFNNMHLKKIAKYANNTYLSVPNDASFTKFYKLDIDNNYNVKPKFIQ